MVRVQVPVRGEVLQPNALPALDGFAAFAVVIVGRSFHGPVTVHILLTKSVCSNLNECNTGAFNRLIRNYTVID